MISIFMISLLSTLSIKFLEGIGIYRKGSLTCGEEDYVSGEGFHKRGKVYRYRNENGITRFESARVLCALMLVAIPLSIGIAVLFYFLK
jgi:ligand-binding sensor protein